MKKKSKAEILRDWGLDPRKVDLRYKNPIEKGIYWYYFSLEIRTRDVNIWGVCISCGRPITIEGSNAGHFMPASDCGRDLLFDPQNVNAECRKCNAWDDTHLLGYAENLDKRYGSGTAKTLRERREAYRTGPPVKDFNRAVYAQKICQLSSYQQRQHNDVQYGV